MDKIWQDIIERDLERKQAQDQFRRLHELEANQGRTIRIDGRELVNFAANDYLGLAQDARLAEAGSLAACEWGAGAGASRLISGTYRLITRLEAELAAWVGKERALFFNSGYNANIGLLSALGSRETVIFCDRANHASIYDGIFLSGSILARYKHCDPDSLHKLLLEHKDVKRKIIISDAVFSMDGDLAPLPRLLDLARQHHALCIVDEAHSIGVFGKDGSGLTAALGLGADVDIIMGTLGKACGVFGAFAACSLLLTEYLVNTCRPFIFTTALPPFVAGALLKALEIIRSENRGQAVLEKAKEFRLMLDTIPAVYGASSSQIVPLIVGSNAAALGFMEHLRDRGIFASAIRPPTVPVNTARIRLSLSWNHTEQDLARLFAAIRDWYAEQQA